jgi:hypothetical protein
MTAFLFIIFGAGTVIHGTAEMAETRGLERVTWAASVALGCGAIIAGAMMALDTFMMWGQL